MKGLKKNIENFVTVLHILSYLTSLIRKCVKYSLNQNNLSGIRDGRFVENVLL